MTTSKWRVSAVAMVMALAACGGGNKPAGKPTPPATVSDPIAVAADPPDPDALPPVPTAPVAQPDSVIAHAHVGSLTALLPAAASFADQVKPGAGMMINDATLRMMASQAGFDLGAVDLTRAAHVLLLDPEEHPSPVVVVVPIGDRDLLDALVQRLGMAVQIHGGYAALGELDALREAGAYALTTVAAMPAPAQPTFDFEVARIHAKYRDGIHARMQALVEQSPPQQRAVMARSLEGYLALLAQMRRASMTIGVEGGRLAWTMRCEPVAGSGMETFIAAQKPGRFDLLAELPPGAITMGGALELGALWDYMTDLSRTSLEQVYGNQDAALAMMAQWRTLMTGENAVAVSIGKTVGVTALWDVDQPAAVSAMWRAYIDALAKTPLTGRMALSIKPDVARHRGVKLSTMTTSPAKGTPPDERAVYDFFGGKLTMGYGVTKARFVLAAGDALGLLKAAIDRGERKTRAIDPSLAPVVAELQARGDSYFIAADVVALRDQIMARVLGTAAPPPSPAAAAGARPPALLAIGTEAGALMFRFTMPAEQLGPLL